MMINNQRKLKYLFEKGMIYQFYINGLGGVI